MVETNENWFKDLFIDEAKGVLESQNGVSSDQIESAVEKYLDENPIGGSGNPAIIDVVELPTENIDENVFYRLLTCNFIFNQLRMNAWTCYVVEGLPETGELAYDGTNATAYYNTQDGTVYGYVPAELGNQLSVPSGWYTLDMLVPALGVPYGGVVNSLDNASQGDTLYLLLERIIHTYSDGWNKIQSIGWAGTGASAEIFNHTSNIASGECSHAEGVASHAEGIYSHAEGYSSHAEGEGSHAEGGYSHAEGEGSHAEGVYSHAEGDWSHAEGERSHAEGDFSHAEGSSSHAEGSSSHAEGWYTHAVGCSQHVQGEFNLLDPNYDPDTPNDRAKYAHIVGNGTSDENRSNAHTLDWEGNAWYAGSVEGTYMILKSTTAGSNKRFKVTVDDNGTLTATELT